MWVRGIDGDWLAQTNQELAPVNAHLALSLFASFPRSSTSLSPPPIALQIERSSSLDPTWLLDLLSRTTSRCYRLQQRFLWLMMVTKRVRSSDCWRRDGSLPWQKERDGGLRRPVERRSNFAVFFLWSEHEILVSVSLSVCLSHPMEDINTLNIPDKHSYLVVLLASIGHSFYNPIRQKFGII